MTVRRDWLYHAARLLLGATFAYAGALKALDLAGFAGQIAAYRLLPEAGNYLLAATLPWTELLAGVLLLTGRKARPAALLLGLLDLLFIAALSLAWVRGLTIDCGCFRPGSAAATSIPLALARDAVLLVAAVTVLWLWPGRRSA